LTAGSRLRRGAVDSLPFLAGTLAWGAAFGAAALLPDRVPAPIAAWLVYVPAGMHGAPVELEPQAPLEHVPGLVVLVVHVHHGRPTAAPLVDGERIAVGSHALAARKDTHAATSRLSMSAALAPKPASTITNIVATPLHDTADRAGVP